MQIRKKIDIHNFCQFEIFHNVVKIHEIEKKY